MRRINELVSKLTNKHVLHIECSDLNAVDGDNESNELTREGIGLHIRGFNITYRSLLFQLIVAILYFLLVG